MFNIIVTYGNEGYFTAKKEIETVLRSFDDIKSVQDLLIPGMIAVTTKLEPRQLIAELSEKSCENPDFLKGTREWIPVDFVCTAENILQILKDEVLDILKLYLVNVINHTKNTEVVKLIKKILPGTEGIAEKIVRIEIFEEKIAVSVLRNRDVFVRV